MAAIDGKQRTSAVGYLPNLTPTIVTAIESGGVDVQDFAPGKSHEYSDIAQVLGKHPGATLEPYFGFSQMETKSFSSSEAFPTRGDRDMGIDLLNAQRIQVSTKEEAGLIVSELQALAANRVAYVESGPVPPPVNPADDVLSSKQGYLDAAPVGTNAKWAWSRADGSGVLFVDLEQGWTLDHEDLSAAAIEIISGENQYYHGHGTAVLGEVVGGDNTIGIIGKAPKASVKVVSQWRSSTKFSTPEAILSATAAMAPGDVLLIEAQVLDSHENYLPVETEALSFAAIVAAVNKGIVVIEAAGNGATDLDQYRDARGRTVLRRGSPHFRDSGAIMVAAASSSQPYRRMEFSNYGSRIDCFAWGEKICTTGDGWEGQAKNTYTFDFGGTSGASPIIAGAAILLQSYAKMRSKPYAPLRLRELLADATLNTSCHGGLSARIGVMPDLKKIIENQDGLPIA